MPLTHALRDRTIWITTVGDVEFEEGLAALGRALDDAHGTDASAGWHIAFDVRDSSERRSSEELRGIARFVGENRAVLSGRCVVIAGDDFHYGLSRQFQAYCELHGLQSSVVRDLKDAARVLRDEPG